MRKFSIICICSFVFCFYHTVALQAVIYDFQIFTTNGNYYDDPGWNLYVEVVEVSATQIDFTFYNGSSIDSSIARIYFDDGSLLGIDEIENGPGTDFGKVFPGPGNLPGGENIGFYADKEFSIGADNPPPSKGVNPPDEWVRITFGLNGGSFNDVIDELNTGVLRIGIHIIALPDGSSESAVPEPATIGLLGLGGCLALLRKRRRV